MQTDPIGYDDGMNWYAYVGNDPVNMIDPDGRKAIQMGAMLGVLLNGGTIEEAGRAGKKLSEFRAGVAKEALSYTGAGLGVDMVELEMDFINGEPVLR